MTSSIEFGLVIAGGVFAAALATWLTWLLVANVKAWRMRRRDARHCEAKRAQDVGDRLRKLESDIGFDRLIQYRYGDGDVGVSYPRPDKTFRERTISLEGCVDALNKRLQALENGPSRLDSKIETNYEVLAKRIDELRVYVDAQLEIRDKIARSMAAPMTSGSVPAPSRKAKARR